MSCSQLIMAYMAMAFSESVIKYGYRTQLSYINNVHFLLSSCCIVGECIYALKILRTPLLSPLNKDLSLSLLARRDDFPCCCPSQLHRPSFYRLAGHGYRSCHCHLCSPFCCCSHVHIVSCNSFHWLGRL